MTEYMKKKWNKKLLLAFGFFLIAAITVGIFNIAEFVLLNRGQITLTKEIFRVVCGTICAFGGIMGGIFVACINRWDLQGIVDKIDNPVAANHFIHLVQVKAEDMEWKLKGEKGK